MTMRADAFFFQFLTALSASVRIAERSQIETANEHQDEDNQEEIADVEVGGEHEEQVAEHTGCHESHQVIGDAPT